MEDISMLVRGPFLKLKNRDFITQNEIVKEGEEEVTIYELNKRKLKNYNLHPN